MWPRGPPTLPPLPCRRRSGCGSHLETQPAPGPSTPPWGSGPLEKKLVSAEPKPPPPPPVQTQPSHLETQTHGPSAQEHSCRARVHVHLRAPDSSSSWDRPCGPCKPFPTCRAAAPLGAPRALLPELPSPYSHDDQEVTWLHSCHHGEGVPTRLVLKTARNSASGIPILVAGTPLCFCPWAPGRWGLHQAKCKPPSHRAMVWGEGQAGQRTGLVRALFGYHLPLHQLGSPPWQNGQAPDITPEPEASSLLPQWKGSEVASWVKWRLEHAVCHSSAICPSFLKRSTS